MAKAKKPEKAQVPKKQPRPPKAVSTDGPVEADVPLADIDTSPAESVRAGYDEQVVIDWSNELAAGEEFPRAVAFRYGTYHALGDGGYRFRAYKLAGRPSLPCEVHVCKSKQEAEDRAYALAAGSNERHGVRRSYDDKRAAVRAVIGRPEYAESSDADIVKLTRTSAFLVRKVRTGMQAAGELSGAAVRKYTESDTDYARRTSGKPPVSVGDEPAAVVDREPGAVEPEPAELPWRERPIGLCGATPVVLAEIEGRYGVATLGELADRFAANETFGLTSAWVQDLIQNLQVASGWTWPADPEPVSADGVTAKVASSREEHKPDIVLDERGRPVPEKLLPAFAGRAWFRAAAQRFGELKRAVRAELATPHGCAIDASTVDVDLDNAAKSVAVAMPYCVCPSCDGEGSTGKGDCGTCGKRGWLSRLRFGQLTPDQRAICDQHKA